MRELLIALFFANVFTVSASACGPQANAGMSHEGEVALTESESLWTGKFADCDYGFRVVLPEKFVAHANLPPNPIRGFLVGLPDTSTRINVSVEDERFVGVSAEYNSLELKSLKSATEYLLDLRRRRNSGLSVTARNATRLGGATAERVKIGYDTPKGRVVEEIVVALRSGIVYEISMRTTAANYESDQPKFTRIIAGFRFWKIHHC